jgi:hypothetical protein
MSRLSGASQFSMIKQFPAGDFSAPGSIRCHVKELLPVTGTANINPFQTATEENRF